MAKPLKRIEIPETVLKRWWWRRLVYVDFDEETHTTQHRIYPPEFPGHAFSNAWNWWHKKDELTAFRFELLRRTSFPDLQDWIYLPHWLGKWVMGVLAPKPERSVCGLFEPAAPPNYASIDWMWDLEASDESLCQNFIMFINEERQRRGLPTSDISGYISGKQLKHGEKRRGKRNRQVSWLAVEAYDLKLYKIRPLSDGERSRLSKAIREMKVFEPPLREALQMANKHKPENHQILPQEHIQARFVRENFLERFVSRIQQG